MKRYLLATVCVTVLSASFGVLGASTYASSHDWAWCSGHTDTVQTALSTVVTANYEASADAKTTSATYTTNSSVDAQLAILKTMLEKYSVENLQRVNTVLDRYAGTVSMDNPNYYLLDVIRGYVSEIIEAKMSKDDIVDIVLKTDDVSILKDIVIALDLVETLQSEGPFTVFAPTNQAFENLLAELWMTFDELAANTDLLRSVVLYHVVGAEVPASAVVTLTQGALVETVWGESLRVNNWNGVQVDDSTVIATDIMASNGIIHLIDEVLLPPSVRELLWMMTDRGAENIVTTAVNAGQFPTLVAAVQAAWLVDVLSGEGPFTVYAPTEEAFAHLLADLNMTAAELLADTDLLTSVLTYHVVPGFYTAEDIMGLTMPMQSPTVQWSTLTIDPHNWSPMVNDSNIVATDVFASNGVIHVIDRVLVPSM